MSNDIWWVGSTAYTYCKTCGLAIKVNKLFHICYSRIGNDAK